MDKAKNSVLKKHFANILQKISEGQTIQFQVKQ